MDITQNNQQNNPRDASRTRITDDMFIGWTPADESTERTEPKVLPVPRLSHKKSKTGCQRCRARRVKCDETKPECGGCSRHKVTCVYDHLPKPSDKPTTEDSRSEASSPSSIRFKHSSNTNLHEIESKKRRLLELKLMHQWTLSTSLTFPLAADPSTLDINTTILPSLSLQNDAMLYCLFFLAALHLAKTERGQETRDVYQHYFGLSIRAHRIDTHNLNGGNADVICMTSSLIRLGSFAILPERELVPYEPPRQWMAMNQGAIDIHKIAWQWLGDNPTSISRRAFAQKLPNLTDFTALYSPSNRLSLLHLLQTPPSFPPEPSSPQIQQAYENTLSYIGGIQIARSSGLETPDQILRRCIGFPGLVPRLFFELVEEKRPRALVILAHYFVELARFRGIWWIGDAGCREVRAIAVFLPVEWGEMMRWCVEEVNKP